MSALSVCGPQSINEGCLQPCDDVLLCVRVERSQNEEGTEDEFVYQFTVQNCSRAVLRAGELRLRLGSFTCDLVSATAMFEATGVVPNYPVDTQTCGAGSVNIANIPSNQASGDWDGLSTASITDDRVLLFSNLFIPPGSWQGWVRFTSTHVPAERVRLPSQVVFSASVFDTDCKSPCRITKCVEADGDNCLLAP